MAAFVSATPLPLSKSLIRSVSPHRPPLVLNSPSQTRASIRMGISPEAARNAIAVYGVVIAGGGVGAFLRSGSKPSIISGVTAGIALAAAYFKDSVPLALCTAAVLAVVFALRFAKSGKFMPAGMLFLASLAAAVFFGVSVYG